MGEILGARIITVPSSLAHQKAQESVFTLLISIICVFALIMIAINMTLKNLVVKPINSLSAIAVQISLGKKNIETFPNIRIYEFKKLMAAIKRLKISRDHTLNLLNQYSGASDKPVQFNMQDILSEPELGRTQKENEIEM